MPQAYCAQKRVRLARKAVGWLWVAIGLLCIGAACGGTPRPVRMRTMSAQAYYAEALQRAQQWRSDVYLFRVTVGFCPVDDLQCSLTLRFGFRSPSDDHHSLMISIEEDAPAYAPEVIDHKIPIKVRNPIEPEDWPLDSVDVLAIAQAHGGDEFLRRHNPAAVDWMKLLLQPLPKVPGARLDWTAQYAVLSSDDKLDIDIDPKTGEVLAVDWVPARESPFRQGRVLPPVGERRAG
jgi:hypothetical protein